MTQVQRDPVVDEILGAAIAVHRFLGPGLLESSYKHALAFEFVERGVPFRAELPVPLIYKSTRLECGYRLDFLVRDAVIVEVKSVDTLLPIHSAQTMTYLRLTGARQALLLNFNELTLKAGIRSFIGKGTNGPAIAADWPDSALAGPAEPGRNG
jgi:GxxExxY protein